MRVTRRSRFQSSNARARERMGTIQLSLAITPDDQHTLFAHLAQQMAEQPQSAAVGPVKIVGIEKQSAFACKGCKDFGDGVEEKQAFFVRGELSVRGKRT